ncbi:hypothetical protein SprV_0301336900 [Sparganum proliferum]
MVDNWKVHKSDGQALIETEITETFKMASRMRQEHDRQKESLAFSNPNPGNSAANIFRHRSSSKRGHELPPLLNDNKIFLIDDTDKAELFSAFFAKHLTTDSEPPPFFRSLSNRTLSTMDTGRVGWRRKTSIIILFSSLDLGPMLITIGACTKQRL